MVSCHGVSADWVHGYDGGVLWHAISICSKTQRSVTRQTDEATVTLQKTAHTLPISFPCKLHNTTVSVICLRCCKLASVTNTTVTNVYLYARVTNVYLYTRVTNIYQVTSCDIYLHTTAESIYLCTTVKNVYLYTTVTNVYLYTTVTFTCTQL